MIASAGCGRGDRNAARALPRVGGHRRTGAVATPGIQSSDGGSGSARVAAVAFWWKGDSGARRGARLNQRVLGRMLPAVPEPRR